MASSSNPPFELLVSVRYDPGLLAPSHENTAIFSTVHNQAYPPDMPELIPNYVPIQTPIYLPHLHQKRLIDAAKYFGWHEALKQLVEGGPLASPAHFAAWICDRVQSSSQNASVEGTEPLKLRILLSSAAQLSLEAAPVPHAPGIESFFPPHLPEPRFLKSGLSQGEANWPGEPSWSITLDESPTVCRDGQVDPHLHFKTTQRDVYNDARSRLGARSTSDGAQERGRSLMSEILLYNENGLITEGSLTSVYFWRDGCWVTPRSLKVGLEGQSLESSRPLAQAGTTRLYALAKGIAVEGDVPKNSICTGEVVWLSNGVRGFGWGVIR